MPNLNRLEVDCSAADAVAALIALTDTEQTAYNTAQPIGAAAAAALAAKLALIDQHHTALNGQYAALTATPATIAADLAAFATIVQALNSGTQPTAAQQVIILRVLCRMLVVLLGS